MGVWSTCGVPSAVGDASLRGDEAYLALSHRCDSPRLPWSDMAEMTGDAYRIGPGTTLAMG